jgi:hypothetical protein
VVNHIFGIAAVLGLVLLLAAVVPPPSLLVVELPDMTLIAPSDRVTQSVAERRGAYGRCMRSFRKNSMLPLAMQKSFCECIINTLPLYASKAGWGNVAILDAEGKADIDRDGPTFLRVGLVCARAVNSLVE